ncbi:eukaryotic translation initiation factor 4b/4h [Anaeramoeba flamelloides]|uniref:Eukaryotic translation initiation factor 4b/4h n=1 Tax=Anaeramoeba flamelloides TaxID=1746091 RepID=A0AAV7ZD29_9EUKA|nr:eukaryotic translation initiation factor 4b/4h [Anaeramoeba flamelloides]
MDKPNNTSTETPNKKETHLSPKKKKENEEKTSKTNKSQNQQNTTNKAQSTNQQEQNLQSKKENQQTTTTKNYENKTKLYIGNISFNSTEESLTKAFSEYGKIKSVNIVKRGERSLGYGFLEMSTHEEANLAIKELHQTTVDGREIIVEYADPNKAKRRRNPKYNYHYYKNYSRKQNYVPYREMIQPFPMVNLSYEDQLNYYERLNYYRMGLNFYPQDNQLYSNDYPYYNYVDNQNSNEYYNLQQNKSNMNDNEDQEKENQTGSSSVQEKEKTGKSNENEIKKNDKKEINKEKLSNTDENEIEKENKIQQNEIQNNDQQFQQQQFQQQQQQFKYYQQQRMFENVNPYYYNTNNYVTQRRVFYPYKTNRYTKSYPKKYSKNSIFITNIPFSISEQDLLEEFKELKPKNSRIVLNSYGKSRGFGFVEFENIENRDKALKFNETKIDGRTVYVKIAYEYSNIDEKEKN